MVKMDSEARGCNRMKKDKAWLKREANIQSNLQTSLSGMAIEPYVISIPKLFHLIDQLDEPEKPVIPQFVAEQLEYWERNKLKILWKFYLEKIPEWSNWLARDKDGELYVFAEKPYKKDTLWWADKNMVDCLYLEETDDTFESVSWEDEQPTNIEELGGRMLREAEPQWVVKTSKSWYFKYFESVKDNPIQGIGTGNKEEAAMFINKVKAEAVALLVDGEVEVAE